MLDVKTTYKEPSNTIKPEMLVRHVDGSIGIVTMVTRKHVHVTWLVNADPDEVWHTNRSHKGGHHFNDFYSRKLLTPCPVGTTVSVTQVDNGK